MKVDRRVAQHVLSPRVFGLAPGAPQRSVPHHGLKEAAESLLERAREFAHQFSEKPGDAQTTADAQANGAASLGYGPTDAGAATRARLAERLTEVEAHVSANATKIGAHLDTLTQGDASVRKIMERLRESQALAALATGKELPERAVRVLSPGILGGGTSLALTATGFVFADTERTDHKHSIDTTVTFNDVTQERLEKLNGHITVGNLSLGLQTALEGLADNALGRPEALAQLSLVAGKTTMR